MSETLNIQSADGIICRAPGFGILALFGKTVPTAGGVGYATGCVYNHTDGGAGTAFYINEGTNTSCSFANVVLGGDMLPGTGISTGVGTVCAHKVVKAGALYKTEILVDMTGLTSAGANQIIGKVGQANCHIGQILTAVNGTIKYGQITCLETPVGGDPDIDLYGNADEATGAQAGALTTLTGEAILLNHGAWTAAAATPIALSALPDPDGYLYLIDGSGTAVIYTAGIFLIELWGV